jgi:hypothetical protein
MFKRSVSTVPAFGTCSVFAIVAFGLAASAVAQSPATQSSTDEMARCQELYGAWSRYNGTSSYSKDVGPEMALEDCRKGNYSAGIGELSDILRRQGITVPPTQSASSPR